MKQWWNVGSLLVAAGILGTVVSAFADSLGIGRGPGIGLWQLLGLVLSTYVIVIGLGRLHFLKTQKMMQILAAIYVAGVFYLGLKPLSSQAHQSRILFSAAIFRNDFILNTVGFIPIGYFFMAVFGIRNIVGIKNNLLKRAIAAAVAAGLISISLELCQYYFIAGRISSLFDVIANVFGSVVGIGTYVVLEQTKLSSDLDSD